MTEVWLTFDYFVWWDLYLDNSFFKSQVFINRVLKGSLECQNFCFLISYLPHFNRIILVLNYFF